MKLDLNKGYFCAYYKDRLFSVDSIIWNSKQVVLKSARDDNITLVTFEDLENIQWIPVIGGIA